MIKPKLPPLPNNLRFPLNQAYQYYLSLAEEYEQLAALARDRSLAMLEIIGDLKPDPCMDDLVNTIIKNTSTEIEGLEVAEGEDGAELEKPLTATTFSVSEEVAITQGTLPSAVALKEETESLQQFKLPKVVRLPSLKTHPTPVSIDNIDVLPPFQTLTRYQAIGKILEQYRGKVLDPLFITRELYGSLSKEFEATLLTRVRQVLRNGKKKNLWQAVENSGGCYTAD